MHSKLLQQVNAFLYIHHNKKMNCKFLYDVLQFAQIVI